MSRTPALLMLALDGRAVGAHRATTEWVSPPTFEKRAATRSGRFAATSPIKGEDEGRAS